MQRGADRSRRRHPVAATTTSTALPIPLVRRPRKKRRKAGLRWKHQILRWAMARTSFGIFLLFGTLAIVGCLWARRSPTTTRVLSTLSNLPAGPKPIPPQAASPPQTAPVAPPEPKLRKDRDHPLVKLLAKRNEAVLNNLPSSRRVDPSLLVPILASRLEADQRTNPKLLETFAQPRSSTFSRHGQFFRVSRIREHMIWKEEWDARDVRPDAPPTQALVDYTQDHLYEYPSKHLYPPDSGYPALRPLHEIFGDWPQDELDRPPSPFREHLQHFDYETEQEAAERYRERKLPFKLTGVPELLAASQKWTDDYVAVQFDGPEEEGGLRGGGRARIENNNDDDGLSPPKRAQGNCQESLHSFFAFFTPGNWNVPELGPPPTRNNDWGFREWAEHAKWADMVRLGPTQPHFYWQAGIPKEERELPKDQWTFVSRDLPSFSSPTPTFLSPSPDQQKGIQCRFGERGVTAATHYDAGRNSVGMITGAKRYVLHPPNQCAKLGIVTSRESSLFRHSLLNFARLNSVATGTSEEEDKDADDETMSPEERAWLKRAGTSMAVETVLKAGEVLFIPSHWFHYIISLQKSAQCNVRSGIDAEGDEEFGGKDEVSPEACLPVASED